MSSNYLFLFIFFFTLLLSSGLSSLLELTEAQIYLYNRLKSKEYVNNPYVHLRPSEVCTGTNSGLSGSRNDYKIFKAIYSNCVYVDGNLEISNFRPRANKNTTFDFSFLDSIREITGYLIIFNTNLKKFRLKNLQIIRGKNLFLSNYSIFIASNENLELLDLTNLGEVQRGSSLISDNPKLCHMNEVLWNDIVKDHENNKILNNAFPHQCSKCYNSCCPNVPFGIKQCGCWFPNGCQKLSRLTCHPKCEERCFGSGKFDCCNKECIGGCTGPTSKDCVACRKFQNLETGECVDSCPRIKMVDTFTGELVVNPNGMYQFGISCVRSCPENLFIYQELCLTKCPNNTNEEEEIINNPVTGEKGLKRICKPCEDSKCKKTCVLSNTDEILDHENLNLVKDCEILNGNLIILNQNLTENDLEVLSSIRIINGFVRIQSDLIRSINFLRNLEVIRAPFLEYSKHSLIISGKLIRFLSLKKLRSIEKGDIVISAEKLCLQNTINWEAITKRKNAVQIKNNLNSSLCDEYKCHVACKGCWSPEQSYCQFCKNYKLEDLCIENCNDNFINNRFTYLENEKDRVCNYCHEECNKGCFGPSENDCFSCANYVLKENSRIKCVKLCPTSHYLDAEKKECLPCAFSCYGCKGPADTIGEKGCTDCNSALVDNDNSFTVLKCILWNNTCPPGYFHDVVNLKDHPLKGRDVCKKCHDECDECNGSGNSLSHGCIKCKNFYSKNSNRCVKNCSIYNEHLKVGSNICSPCLEECKSGCQGLSLFECNECRGYKLKLSDVEKMVEFYFNEMKLNNFNQSFNIEQALKNTKKQSFSHVEKKILENYAQFIKKSSDKSFDATVFCVPECPKQFPFMNLDLYCSSKKNDRNSTNHFIIFFPILIVLSILIIFLLILIVKKSNERRLKIFEKDTYDYTSDWFNDYQNEKFNTSNLLLVNDNELEQCTFLGQGAFGTVYSGFYIFNDEKNKQYKLHVAIKKLNYFPTMNKEKIKELENEIINEATLMASVDHKYCLKLTGLCIAQPIKIVTQLIPKGSVVTVLQKNRSEISERHFLIWAQQIAEGMEYLENKGIVHRDLAARNILVKDFDHIKITDFGLAKVLDSEEKAFYAKSNSLLPIKWLAIESIQSKIFTHESDVWSYGVCLWEIFTFCAKPYAEIETINIIDYLKNGARLAQPKIASIEVYAILLKCWLENPYSRPSFKELNSIFARMSVEPKNYLSFKSFSDLKFITINQNTESLIRKDLDEIFYAQDGSNKNRIEKKSNNEQSISPDEGIELNSIEIQSEKSYQKDNAMSNYNQSLVVFKRNSKVDLDIKLKDYDIKPKRNKSLLQKLLPKRFDSNGSNTTASTLVSSAYSDQSSRIIRQSDSLNYEEQQSLFTSSSSNLPTRSNSSNSSNNSSIYNYNNSKFKENNSASDYLEPIMQNVKQNLEYFDDPNQKKINSIILKNTKKFPKIIKKNQYYNDSFI